MSHAAVVRAVLAAALIAGCSGKKDEERVLPPEAPEVAPGPAQPAATPTPAPPAAPQLGALPCDQLVPQAMRETYLAGKELQKQPMTAETDLRCTATDGDLELVVAASCPAARTGSLEDTVKLAREARKDAKDLAGVGSAALRLETAKLETVIAWDDDSACHVEVTVPAAGDAAALAKELLAALPPKVTAEKPADRPAEGGDGSAAGSASATAGSAAAPSAGSAASP